ncbi:hypothetical protein [Streptomyces altiplanensis]
MPSCPHLGGSGPDESQTIERRNGPGGAARPSPGLFGWGPGGSVLGDAVRWDEAVTKPGYEHLHPGAHKVTVVGTALSAPLGVVRAPRSLPSPIVAAR